jgi:hypothetical protein
MNWWLFALQIAAVALTPFAMAAQMAFHDHESRMHWLRTAVFTIAITAMLWVLPIWHVIGPWLRWVQVSAVATGMLYTIGDVPALPWWNDGKMWPQALATAGYTALSGVVLFWAWGVYSAGIMPEGQSPVELEFPLHDGRYYVVSGGSTKAGNRHRNILDTEKADESRGQAQALDIVQLNSWGIRAKGLYPHDKTDYRIFGTPVYAPCSGEVVRVRDGLTDYDPPGRDRENLAGNHVVLECDGVHVALAHLKKGSVTVQRGNAVKVGQNLGEIGNSGNTTEPHLHIHAQTPSENEHFMGGDPLPMTFGGEYLGPGEVVRVQTN